MQSFGFVLNGVFVPTGLFVLLTAISLLFLLPLMLFWRWMLYRYRIQNSRVSKTYNPPLGFNPVRTALLFGRRNGDRLVAATIVSLIQRGYLVLRKNGVQKILVMGPRVTDRELAQYEARIIEDVEHGVEYARDIYATSKKHAGIIAEVRSEMIDKGYFVKNRWFARVVHCISVLALAIIFGLALPLGSAWCIDALSGGTASFAQLLSLARGAFSLLPMWLPPLLLGVGLLDYRRGLLLGQRWYMTRKGRGFLPQFIGFQEYTRLVRAGKVRFETEILEKSAQKETLPYAVAFGSVKSWRKLLS